MTRAERLAWILAMPEAERQVMLAKLSESEREEMQTHWRLWRATSSLRPLATGRRG